MVKTQSALESLRQVYDAWYVFRVEYGWLFELAVVAVVGFIILVVLDLLVFV